MRGRGKNGNGDGVGHAWKLTLVWKQFAFGEWEDVTLTKEESERCLEFFEFKIEIPTCKKGLNPA